jgi:hypothetical protein
MFCRIGLQATTTEISSYMIRQSYWKMYHWQSEHECGTCMMVLRHILAVLCEMFSITPSRPLDRYRRTHCMASMLARFESSELLPVGHLRVCSSCWQRRGTSSSHWGCLSDCPQLPGILERMRRSMMGRVEACIESHGGHFEHLV